MKGIYIFIIFLVALAIIIVGYITAGLFMKIVLMAVLVFLSFLLQLI